MISFKIYLMENCLGEKYTKKSHFCYIRRQLKTPQVRIFSSISVQKVLDQMIGSLILRRVHALNTNL
jgi:hypothetical protein